MLHLPLFRTCRQIRSETLSYLCANLPLKILGIETANVFFDMIGIAIREVTTLTVVQPVDEISSASWAVMERFFCFMDRAKGLRELWVENLGDMALC